MLSSPHLFQCCFTLSRLPSPDSSLYHATATTTSSSSAQIQQVLPCSPFPKLLSWLLLTHPNGKPRHTVPTLLPKLYPTPHSCTGTPKHRALSQESLSPANTLSTSTQLFGGAFLHVHVRWHTTSVLLRAGTAKLPLQCPELYLHALFHDCQASINFIFFFPLQIFYLILLSPLPRKGCFTGKGSSTPQKEMYKSPL